MIGIVTILFNSDEVLPGFFESLGRQRGIRYRLYVIDNSKSDSGSRLSRELANFHSIDAEIVFNNANVGVAGGNNQGIERALGDGCTEVLLTNNDIEFNNPDLIANLRTQMYERQLTAIVPKIYFYGLDRKIWFAGGRFSKLSATTPHLGFGQEDRGQFDTLARIDYAPTCFMLLRASVFKQIGIMDEKYFVYYDDTDFLWRMKQGGLYIGFCPEEIILHKASHSTGGDVSDFSIFYCSRNRIYFIRKHYGTLWTALSLVFFFGSRLLKSPSLTAGQRAAMWRGIRDGLRLITQSSWR